LGKVLQRVKSWRNRDVWKLRYGERGGRERERERERGSERQKRQTVR
jgi:hypothetical protein